jgi:hypothetical protein
LTINDILLNHGIAAATGGEIKDINGVKYKPIMGPGEIAVLLSGPSLSSVVPEDFIEDADHIYTYNSTRIYKYSKATLELVATGGPYTTTDQGTMIDIAVDGTHIYAITQGASPDFFILRKIDKSTMLQVQEISLGSPTAYRVEVNSTRVYVGKRVDSSGYNARIDSWIKANLTTGAVSSASQGGGTTNTVDYVVLACDDNYVYWGGRRSAGNTALANAFVLNAADLTAVATRSLGTHPTQMIAADGVCFCLAYNTDTLNYVRRVSPTVSTQITLPIENGVIGMAINSGHLYTISPIKSGTRRIYERTNRVTLGSEIAGQIDITLSDVLQTSNNNRGIRMVIDVDEILTQYHNTAAKLKKARLTKAIAGFVEV